MTRTPARPALLLGALLLALPLAACGDDEPAASPAAETETAEAPEPGASEPTPADEGERIQGEGYSYALPDGWEDASERFRSMDPLFDTGAVVGDSGGAFADNVNVIHNDDFPEMTLEEAEETLVEEVDAISDDVEVRPRTEVDGETAIHISGLTTAPDQTQVFTEQVSVYRNEAWHIITFSFGPETPAGDREALMDAVLASWTWE